MMVSGMDKNRILVVDDETANIVALTNILSPDYTVYAAKNGPDAIKLAKDKLPDLILLDVLMPEMSGYEILSALKEIEETREIFVIFITGLSTEEYEEKGLALGADDYIPKPFSPAIVKLRVRKQIEILNFTRALKSHAHALVENSPNLVLYLTADAKVEYANPVLPVVTDYTKSELITEGLGVIFGEEMLAKMKEKHIPEALRGEKVRYEATIIRKSGKMRTLLVTMFQIGKNNLGIISEDLTDLLTAKARAEHSSRAKSEFLARMNCEMLTPLNAIMGKVQIVKMQDIPDEIEEHLDNIDTASRHLLSLVNDVLDVSGMGCGLLKLTDSDFSFRALLHTLLKDAVSVSSTHNKQHNITHKIDQSIPEIFMGDEKRLSKVIGNLLSNAIKFTPKNGEICVNARVLKEDNGIITLQVEVVDNGIGIPENQQGILFDIFEQVDGSVTRKHGGIGIGLPLSKRIVEMMGGNIWVESESGKGAKFIFTCNMRKAS